MTELFDEGAEGVCAVSANLVRLAALEIFVTNLTCRCGHVSVLFGQVHLTMKNSMR